MRGISRKGSALLIVLGMLSFMVVSAVGFSFYMRSSRVPSSYLRRNIAARYLVRSALAKAIEELEGDFNNDPDWGKIDETDATAVPQRFYGIYDDPFPGVVLGDSSARSNPSLNGDYWAGGRVFMPFGPVRSDRDKPSATVPTLTLEALAYLPPAIVDDVRRLSRLTRTASWRAFPYDSGRYAYCAVNVSDMFDINRLRANVPRNSGRDRITLASLCAKTFGEPTDIDAGAAAELDRLLDKVENNGKLNGNVVPFTSIADFNVVAGSGSDYAPFMDFIGTSDRGPLARRSSSSKTANAMFITDTWFPPTNAVGQTVFDLGSNAQPFKDYNASSFLTTLLSMNNADGVDQLYQKNLGLGIACLYDYLDSDSKPISLTIPTVEAVPMVVGIGHPAGLQPALGEIGTPEESEVPGLSGTACDDDGNPVNVNNIVAKRICRKFGITSFGNRITVTVVATCPFKRLKTEQRAKAYSLRGLMRVWLAPDGMGCRPSVADSLYPAQADWRNGDVKNGVATFLSDIKTLTSFNNDIQTTADAIVDGAEVALTFSDLDVQMPIYYKVEESTPTAPAGYRPPVAADESNFRASYSSFGNVKDIATALRPLTVAGGIDGTWKGLADNARFNTTAPYPSGVTELDVASLQTEYRLYAAVWVQVMDGSQVVDMVPACVTDDNEWLSASLPENNAIIQKTGDGAPLLNFKADAAIKYADIETTLAAPPVFTAWKALYAVDPRYNFAPEDWFSSTASDVASKQEWMQLLGLNGASSSVMGQGGRDRDIFMFVSDQEYLQSIGELQFLPRLDVMDGSANFMTGDYSPNFHGKPFSDRTGPTTGDFANGGRFWKTYTAFDNGDGTIGINPYAMQYNGKEVAVLPGSSGFKLNPFSADDRVITAALVGTPFDYYVASTNSSQVQSGGNPNRIVANMTLSQMMDTYSFGKSSLAKMSADDLFDIAGAISDAFRNRAEQGYADWLAGWNSLMWQEIAGNRINDENKTFIDAGVTLENTLHGVDRKYLYSFWRDCFDNRQQLFLIFVRAEPSSVGGGSLSRASSQLGARAVALVWRDPAVPEKNAASRRKRAEFNSLSDVLNAREQCPPHRTRVLFYHQFD
ncbi:MAG: hypothetical protein IKF72_06680 [Kiritimatiellae bacterium]|nr:hypothetical protein [Kiritimatiellia bacterium]